MEGLTFAMYIEGKGRAKIQQADYSFMQTYFLRKWIMTQRPKKTVLGRVSKNYLLTQVTRLFTIQSKIIDYTILTKS